MNSGVAEPNPIELAARALRQGDRSRHEIDEKLARAGIGADARAESLATLERLGYVDDDRFAEDRAEALSARGYGDAHIRFDLERHGSDGRVGRAGAGCSGAGIRPRTQSTRATRRHAADAPEDRLPGSARKGFADESLEGIVAARDDVA